MKFGPQHYVPILKIKRGEKAALLQLAPPIQASITPLLEVAERNPLKVPTVAKHLDNAFRE